MKWLCLAGVCLLLQACGGGSAPEVVPDQPVSCSVTDQRENLQAFMRQQYYWNAELAAPNASAASIDAYFQSMLYTPPDRYSFTQSTESYRQVFTLGRRLGY